MSTRSTIYNCNRWTLTEEMIAEETELTMVSPQLDLMSSNIGHLQLTVTLPPDLIEYIAKAHAEKKFPHQRNGWAGPTFPTQLISPAPTPDTDKK